MSDQRTNPEQDDVTLAEIEVESDIMDADVEGLAPAPERPAMTPVEPVGAAAELDEVDLAEADASADITEADVAES